MNSIYLPTNWEYSVSIPLTELGEYMSEEDYDKYKNQFLSVEIELFYKNFPGDPDSGINQDFSFVDWNSSKTYPESIVNAINKRLLEYENEYSELAYERLCDFIDYQKYGNN